MDGAKSNGVTVVVHTYNQEQYVSRCINSILSQDFLSGIFILIIDDCSTDKTVEICEVLRRKYPDKIRIVALTKNESQQRKLIGLEHYLSIKTKYISWCDGDDYWIDNSKINKQIKILENDLSIGIVHSDFLTSLETINGNQINERPGSQVSKALAFRQGKDLVYGNHVKHSTAMIAKQDIDFEFVGGAQGIIAGDWLIYISATRNKVIHFMTEKTAVVRVTRNGMWNGASTNTHREQKSRLRWYCAANLPDSDLLDAFRRRVLFDWLKTIVSESSIYALIRPVVMYLRKLSFLRLKI